MVVVAAAVDGLIECATCFLRQQFWNEEKVICLRVTNVALTDSLFLFFFNF